MVVVLASVVVVTVAGGDERRWWLRLLAAAAAMGRLAGCGDGSRVVMMVGLVSVVLQVVVSVLVAVAHDNGGEKASEGEIRLANCMKMNTASSSGSGTLPSNTITNPKEDLKGITTRNGITNKGPKIPTTSSSPQVVERETKVTKDTVPPTNNGSTKDVQPLVVQVETQIPNSEPVVAPVVEPVEALVKGDILLLEEFLNDDPSSPPLPPQELKVVEQKNEKSSINEPLMVELKDLSPHLEYAFLEGDNNYPSKLLKT
nr:reverse transcriptase domain-containing protein [Tanacetum cinerariifolium]